MATLSSSQILLQSLHSLGMEKLEKLNDRIGDYIKEADLNHDKHLMNNRGHRTPAALV